MTVGATAPPGLHHGLPVAPIGYDLADGGPHREQAMIGVVAANLNAIRALCREYGVARLDPFGSAASDCRTCSAIPSIS